MKRYGDAIKTIKEQCPVQSEARDGAYDAVSADLIYNVCFALRESADFFYRHVPYGYDEEEAPYSIELEAMYDKLARAYHPYYNHMELLETECRPAFEHMMCSQFDEWDMVRSVVGSQDRTRLESSDFLRHVAAFLKRLTNAANEEQAEAVESGIFEMKDLGRRELGW